MFPSIQVILILPLFSKCLNNINHLNYHFKNIFQNKKNCDYDLSQISARKTDYFPGIWDLLTPERTHFFLQNATVSLTNGLFEERQPYYK